jgi:signal transduction histidine kinase
MNMDDGLIGSHVLNLPYGDLLTQWLSQPGSHEDWSPTSDRFFQPMVQPLATGNGIMLTLRDTTEVRKLARNQNEFIRLLSHDLRTPLTYILGFASMLEQQVPNALNEKQQHFVSKIMTGIEQITRIVENIQDAGRFDPETGFYEMSRSPVDVGILVIRLVQQTVIPLTKPRLHIDVVVDEMLPIVSADSSMLERAITNLVDNAIKYTPDGGKIWVRVYRDHKNIVVQVQDDGLGIDPADAERLFHRHVRIRRPEFNKIKGSGLGLFIVRSVAHRHEGHAWVESKLGEGSSFFLSLPMNVS